MKAIVFFFLIFTLLSCQSQNDRIPCVQAAVGGIDQGDKLTGSPHVNASAPECSSRRKNCCSNKANLESKARCAPSNGTSLIVKL